MELDEAIAILLAELRAGRTAAYGYDLYSRKGAEVAAAQLHPDNRERVQRATRELSSLFMEAAWQLCLRGIVRPGVTHEGAQAVPDGGYSLTEAGRAMLPNLDATAILLSQPGSLAATLQGYSGRFGAGFIQRAMEAIKCRNAQSWLACCAMVGAAAESILLRVAIAKTNDENAVLTAYRRAGGRQAVLNLIVGQATPQRRDTLTTFASIISLWRDEAAHGQSSPISTANADEALRQLLHMCQWVDAEWQNLMAANPQVR